MAKTIIELPKPTKQDLQRIEEIKFYLFVMNLIKINKNYDEKINYFLENICDIINSSKSVIIASALEIVSPHNRPTKYEIIVGLAYLKTPIRKIYKHTNIHHITYYKIIGEFLNYKQTLKPNFDENRIKHITDFNQKIKELFDIMEVL